MASSTSSTSMSCSQTTAPSQTPFSSLTPSLTPTASASPGNGTGPEPPAANSANTLTPEQKLGLGFGLTTGLLVIGGVLLGCFGRQAIFQAQHWLRQHIFKPKPKQKLPSATRLSAIPTAPGVVHLSMNPALLQQQSALELLQLARQQRLEAIQAQKEQLELTSSSNRTLDRLQSFKKTYKPMMVPVLPDQVPMPLTGSSV